MKKRFPRLAVLLFFVLAIGGAFWLGRFTAPPDRLTVAEEADLSAAWTNFIKAQEKSLALVKAQEQFTDGPQSMAEGYRAILYNMIGAIRVSALQNPASPYFERMPDLGSKSGMDNPDNEYKMAIIRGDWDYRITGQLGSGRSLHIQSVGG